jgi:polyisoprenoid-binding protein YceI
MKKKLFIVTVTLLSTFFLQAQNPSSWNVDLEHSSVEFKISHLFSTVTGRFNDFQGTFVFDPNNLKASNANFTISVKSVDTHNGTRDTHLQSEDFFNVVKYPTMSFVSSKITKVSADTYEMSGKLSIRNITKDVVLVFKVAGVMDSPWAKGVQIMGINASTTINRNDYGVGSGSWAATTMVGNDVKIEINLELDNK